MVATLPTPPMSTCYPIPPRRGANRTRMGPPQMMLGQATQALQIEPAGPIAGPSKLSDGPGTPGGLGRSRSSPASLGRLDSPMAQKTICNDLPVGPVAMLAPLHLVQDSSLDRAFLSLLSREIPSLRRTAPLVRLRLDEEFDHSLPSDVATGRPPLSRRTTPSDLPLTKQPSPTDSTTTRASDGVLVQGQGRTSAPPTPGVTGGGSATPKGSGTGSGSVFWGSEGRPSPGLMTPGGTKMATIVLGAHAETAAARAEDERRRLEAHVEALRYQLRESERESAEKDGRIVALEKAAKKAAKKIEVAERIKAENELLRSLLIERGIPLPNNVQLQDEENKRLRKEARRKKDRSLSMGRPDKTAPSRPRALTTTDFRAVRSRTSTAPISYSGSDASTSVAVASAALLPVVPASPDIPTDVTLASSLAASGLSSASNPPSSPPCLKSPLTTRAQLSPDPPAPLAPPSTSSILTRRRGSRRGSDDATADSTSLLSSASNTSPRSHGSATISPDSLSGLSTPSASDDSTNVPSSSRGSSGSSPYAHTSTNTSTPPRTHSSSNTPPLSHCSSTESFVSALTSPPDQADGDDEQGDSTVHLDDDDASCYSRSTGIRHNDTNNAIHDLSMRTAHVHPTQDSHGPGDIIHVESPAVLADRGAWLDEEFGLVRRLSERRVGHGEGG